MRELRNVVTRLVLFPELLHEMFAPASGSAVETSSVVSAASVDEMASATSEDNQLEKWLELTLPEAREAVLRELERKYVTAKLRRHDGNISRAAESMGVSRQLPHRLLDRHGLRAR